MTATSAANKKIDINKDLNKLTTACLYTLLPLY